MGMYDSLQCKYPLPLPKTQGLLFQTKDLERNLDMYEINEDGVLMRCELDYEAARAKLREKGAKALHGLQELAELARTEQKHPVDFNGELRFYSDYNRDGSFPHNGDHRVEYVAVFHRGHLKALHLVKNTAQ